LPGLRPILIPPDQKEKETKESESGATKKKKKKKRIDEYFPDIRA
jgi:hypothetical protein